MKPIKTLVTLVLALWNWSAFSQDNSFIEGVWKGTSVCQVKNSPCHDEKVVYHISKIDSSNLFKIFMSKIVNEQEEEIGSMIFEYDALKQALILRDTIRKAQWVFNLEGKRIKGTLIYQNNLYRVIDLKKED